MEREITNLPYFRRVDNELAMIQCFCGQKFIISMLKKDVNICIDCGRKFYFRSMTKIYEILD